MSFRDWKFSRLELAGSLGDLGTLIPIAVGMVMVCGLDPLGVFLAVGLLYILGGLYYGCPIAVQPMKVVGAYGVAVGATALQVSAAGWMLGGVLLVLGLTGLVDRVSKLVGLPVVRGVQLTTGLLLASKGVGFVAGTSSFQASLGKVEPWLSVQAIPIPGLGEVPITLLLGAGLAVLALLTLDSKRYPAGLGVVLAGLVLGLALGGWRLLEHISPGAYLPAILPFGLPDAETFGWAAVALVLPQIPMTLGNAVIANRDLSWELFPAARKVTDRSLCVSMGLGNLVAALVGGMPMCHGAGGLAAHYRFGARTGGSNIIIGAVFVALALVLGPGVLEAVRLMPLSGLGVLLFFAGAQLCLTIADLRERSQLFVPLAMAAIALASNLAWAFAAGLLLERVVRAGKVSV